MVPPPNQSTVGVCTQITLLILYYIRSRAVTLFKVTDSLITVPDIFDITVSFKLINFSFQVFLPSFLICLLASRLTLFGSSTLLWFVSCNHRILAYLLWSKNRTHFSTNHGLCCFNSYRPWLSLAEVLIFPLMFSQAYFRMSCLSLEFSKPANLFVILIRYRFLTSSSFNFLRLNLSLSKFCAACLLTANLSLTFATIK